MTSMSATVPSGCGTSGDSQPLFWHAMPLNDTRNSTQAPLHSNQLGA
jgi:hypothetical protein